MVKNDPKKKMQKVLVLLNIIRFLYFSKNILSSFRQTLYRFSQTFNTDIKQLRCLKGPDLTVFWEPFSTWVV